MPPENPWNTPWSAEEPGLCGCWSCVNDRAEEMEGFQGFLYTQRFIVCEHCGNKRCPHATAHILDCTGSNEPNQPGSRYQYDQNGEGV